MRRKINDYDTPHIIGGKNTGHDRRGGKKRSLKKIFLFAFIAAVVLFGIFFGIYIYAPFNFRLKKAEYYVLTLTRTDSLLAAENVSKTVSAAGGAGYILNDGDFLVAAFVYKSENDARVILERFSGDYPAAEIKKYNFEKTKVKRAGDRAAEEALKELLNYPLELIDELIGYVYQLDSFESGESAVMLKIEDIKGILKQKSDDAEALAAGRAESCYKAADEFYRDVYQRLNEVSLLTDGNKKLTYRLKNISCEFVEKYFALRQKL